VARFDGKQVAPLEWVGVLAVVVSFLSWRHIYGPSVSELLRTLSAPRPGTPAGFRWSCWPAPR
jgi:hypothetical protein